MKQTIILLFLSILTILLPSTLCSLSLYMFYGNFLAWFLLSFGVVFIIGIISNNYLSKKFDKTLLNNKIKEAAENVKEYKKLKLGL